MLAGAVVELALRYRHITSIARTGESLRRLDQRITEATDDHAPTHTILPCDYRNRADFLDTVDLARADHGPVDCALVWMHGPTGSNGSIDLARHLASPSHTTDFYHVLGSGSIPDLRRSLDVDRLHFDRIDTLRYHQIVLGYVEEEGGRRWLRDEEIADGVVEGMLSAARLSVVGRIA